MAAMKTSEEFVPLSKCNTQFALDLYHKLSEGGGNIFCSPFSIYTALAMTHLGTRGNTHDEMLSTMYLSDYADYHSLLAKINSTIFSEDCGYTLKIANRLFGHQAYDFRGEFLDDVKKHYSAELRSLDFATDTEGSRKTINEWVEEQTANKIKDLIQPGILNALTRLVLVNAIYFKGNWLSQFDKDNTRQEKFYIDKMNDVNVDMMHDTDNYAFWHGDGFKSIEIPYEHKHLSMIVILPDKRDGLETLEKGINYELLVKMMSRKRPVKVVLVLPKFKFEKSFELNDVLQALGIKDLFDDSRADLSAMDGTRLLFISKALTKAFIDVNEEGSEAAAATAMVAMMRCAMGPRQPPPEFIADHPFMFLIKDNRTNIILFMGRVTDPSS